MHLEAVLNLYRNHCDMFRCQYTIFREFIVVLAKVMAY
jgi:hypothetical protein